MKTFKLNTIKYIACMLATFSLHFVTVAQAPLEIDLKTPYYIDVNNVSQANVYEIQEGLLSLQYHDKIGWKKEIEVTVFNERSELVATYALDKNFGLNHFIIDLKKSLGEIPNNKNYHCQLLDESGNKYQWTFKQIEPVKSDLTVNIFVNPRRMKCTGYNANLVEFSGDIKKGNAPYTVRWYVMNLGKTDFLYQPKELIVEASGTTSAIQVDQNPAYYVMIDVTDACGTNAKKMVLMDCKNRRKKINSIFVEPLRSVKKLPVLTN
jgi:hypothetical protein